MDNWNNSDHRSAISDTIIIGIGVATLVRVINIIMSYQYYKELQIIISAYQHLPKLAKELYQVITVRETTMYHGNDSERNMSAAVLKKLLDVCSSIYPMFHLSPYTPTVEVELLSEV